MRASAIDDGRLALVTLDGPALTWGIELRSLSRIEARATWTGAPPLDLAATFGAPAVDRDHAARVLVIDTGDGELPIVSTGQVRVQKVPWDAIHPLPPTVIGSPRARFFTGIVFGEDGAPPLLIVDVLGLAASLARPSFSGEATTP